ncbi:hypothetical protein GCM10011414_26020 [Croceivirga lutea]|nr:hypothetical protein GCM10011414_26020 [Croceivirga lutea]
MLPAKKYNQQPKTQTKFQWPYNIPAPTTYLGNKTFQFLNLKEQFSQLDWNYDQHGKLWTYNLNYFDFLNQSKISDADAQELLASYKTAAAIRKDGIEPYPISLRGINWIKYSARTKILDPELATLLYQDFYRLLDQLEYHLLANHLLENGFALVFGGHYFQDEKLLKKGNQIVKKELQKQILSDGAHYELSPMYHQILVHRVLDSYQLVSVNQLDEHMATFLKEKAVAMLGWLKAISWADGSIPLVNDAANGIAPTTEQLVEYAQQLGISASETVLGESGYRKLENTHFEVVLKATQISPTYQPGHAHADTLHLLLHYQGQPILVDTGTSTYEKNERRQRERSTSAHNTVTVNGENSSAVWDGFRVGKRAKVTYLKSAAEQLKASHNGYEKWHTRTVRLVDNILYLEDELVAGSLKTKSHFHFHPNCKPIIKNNLVLTQNLCFEFEGIEKLALNSYEFAEEYNKRIPAQKITLSFVHTYRVKIYPRIT